MPVRLRVLVALAVLVTIALGVGGGAVAQTAAPAPQVAPVVLPRDHGAHAGFGMEWWYSAGLVKDAAGHRYSYFATIWKAGTAGLAHVNLIDLDTNKTVLSSDDLSPAATIGTASRSITVGRMSYRWQASPGRFGRFLVHATTTEGAIDLTLTPQRAYVLHGKQGVIQQGRGGPSAYYSATRLAVTVKRRVGGATRTLSGEGWFDHQWGNFTANPEALHWDWFACRLDDGRDLMLYRFLDLANKPLPQAYTGTLVSKTGKVTHLSSFTVTERAPFVSTPALGATYPLGWRLQVPRAGLDLTLKTLATNQFLTIAAAGTIWEGAARTTSGAPGLCYVEDSRNIFAAPPAS
jgi:predicted secreted hydrolase